jgi:t-SNARE complex subunit (syntaxin)
MKKKNTTKRNALRYLSCYAILTVILFMIMYSILRGVQGIDLSEALRISIVFAAIMSFGLTMMIMHVKTMDDFYQRYEAIDKEAGGTDSLERLKELYFEAVYLSCDCNNHVTEHTLLKAAMLRENILRRINEMQADKLKDHEKTNS